MTARRFAAIAISVLALLSVAGCGGTQTTQDLATPTAAPFPQEQRSSGGADGTTGDATEYSAVEEGGAGATPSGSAAEPMIVRNGMLELRVGNVNESLTELRRAVETNQGEIADLSVSAGVPESALRDPAASSPTFASITIRVPADRLDVLTEELAALGTVLSQSESSTDVTEQAIDMEARLKNLRAEEERLRSFLDRATKVSDLLEVQRELARARGDIEAMDAQLTYLKRQVARATLQVTLSKPGPVTGPDSPWFGIREAFSRGVQGAFTVIQALITVLVAALPLAAVVGLVVWAIVAVVRRSNRRAHLPAPEPDDATGDER